MSIVKLNNRSVKDITAFGSITSLGSLTHIATQTASSSASLSFTSGINSTYKEYIFFYVNMNPASDGVFLQFNGSIDSGSNYNVTKTTTFFNAEHSESGGGEAVAYQTSRDLAQSTAFANITRQIGSASKYSCSGYLHLFNPSSSVFVKHFISRSNNNRDLSTDYQNDNFISGYFNDTNDIDAVSFQMSSGNIDSGQILLFGLN